MSALSGGYCCKSPFAAWDSNSPSRRCDDWMTTWGTTPQRAKLVGDSGIGFEALSTGDCRLFRFSARNWPLRLLGLLQHGVIPGSSQTKAKESALQESERPASCGLATMESGNGVLCRTGRVVEANIDLCGRSDGVGRARGRGRFRS